MPPALYETLVKAGADEMATTNRMRSEAPYSASERDFVGGRAAGIMATLNAIGQAYGLDTAQLREDVHEFTDDPWQDLDDRNAMGDNYPEGRLT